MIENNISNSNWVKFDSYREMKVMFEGKLLVIRPSDLTIVVPLFCSLCEFPNKNSLDSIAYRKLGCCHACSMFCEGKKENITSENWTRYIKERELLSRPKFIFK